ncbi:hypothetical protein JCM21714_355 [Gracilibacillus boraciitolerans JCM 21714]|uniref:Uncharacterized protein n=1 Tax=Gracilibacillus boraciitolerans JCM 21714 TaxID=1298598 RepID=W4VE19_9BACI|nr:hypothetical protein [Gracilibacillus boraciitolerans]GAE91406.1 hypothetical protein JCM21714_355 [Gracilibacillus boraciitolerans JCM 21714]
MKKELVIYTKETCETKLDYLIAMVEEIEYTFEIKISHDLEYSYWNKKEGA